MAEAPSKRSLNRTPQVCHRRPAVERSQQVKGYTGTQCASKNLFWWMRDSFICWKNNVGNEYDPPNFFLEKYDYSIWFEDKELDDTTSRKSVKSESDMRPLEGD